MHQISFGRLVLRTVNGGRDAGITPLYFYMQHWTLRCTHMIRALLFRGLRISLTINNTSVHNSGIVLGLILSRPYAISTKDISLNRSIINALIFDQSLDGLTSARLGFGSAFRGPSKSGRAERAELSRVVNLALLVTARAVLKLKA